MKTNFKKAFIKVNIKHQNKLKDNTLHLEDSNYIIFYPSIDGAL